MCVVFSLFLHRYMDVCSSSRVGGGAAGADFFAIKYNGGILTAEPEPKEDYRAWGPGQWWQNLRLPYYPMLAEVLTRYGTSGPKFAPFRLL